MNRNDLINKIREKKSFLCVGLDSDIKRIPKHLLKYDDPIFEFNRRIIDATIDSAVAYKPNLAFYEALGPSGFVSLKKTMDYLPKDVFTIADAKRGDIGNTAEKYAEAYFEYFGFDSITVSPYMGADTLEPYLKYDDKWVIALALTSNPGSCDFQKRLIQDDKRLYITVMETLASRISEGRLMFVVGATQGEEIALARKVCPNHFFLVPGVGAQGGDVGGVVRAGMTSDVGLLINSSRGIIYSGADEDFEVQAKAAAVRLRDEMAQYL